MIEKTADTVTKRKPKVKQPSLYKVILLNDDFTPMEFVVYILINFFSMNSSQATHLMLRIHTCGKGICGVFTKEIAETKVETVNRYSREHKHPLLCIMEKDDV
ncbi:MAG: ATP-dependent Clp protease adapter ClpS [Chromatiales bacterium]|nr:ATP-dependent Clp protease adapter ClpS [Chromatiales bacterium]